MTERNETPTEQMTGEAADDFVDVENYFGGTGYAGGSLTAEAESIARNLRAVTFTDDEEHLLTGRRCLRLADVLDRVLSENERLTSTVATLKAELEPRDIDDEMGKRTVRWGLDDPALDGTDAAHPAWWRGNDDGVKAVVKIVNDLLDGKPHVGTFGNADLEMAAQRIATLTDQLREARERADAFDAACVKALDARDAALAENARLKSALERLRLLDAKDEFGFSELSRVLLAIPVTNHMTSPATSDS